MSQELFNLREWQTSWFAQAVADGRFETWYQPIVDTANRDLVGHECLVRLLSQQELSQKELSQKNAGEVRTYSGAEIIDAARARNEIRPFDGFARTLAVSSAALQRHLGHLTGGENEPAAPFFINFLPTTIDDPSEAMQPVMEIVALAGLKPSDFVFEVVEADLIGDSARLRRIHDYLRTNGFGFALDNVGIGSDPMQCVSDLRPDFVKIDRSVSWNVEQPHYAATIRKLVEIADNIGSKVIACGVERPRTVENLWLLGVEIMQGYLFGRPSPNVTAALTAGAHKPSPILRQTPAAQHSDLANLARALAPAVLPARTEPILQPASPASRIDPRVDSKAGYHQDIFLIHSNPACTTRTRSYRSVYY